MQWGVFVNKDDLINLKKELETRCISLTKFLINYCGIYNDEIHNIKISHQDIKTLMPNLKRVSFESLLNNKKSFYIGDIIPVKDCYGNVVPYINPMIEYNVAAEIDCEATKCCEKLEEITIDETLSNYELVKLCRLLKEHHKTREYREAHKLLKKNKDENVKKYKRQKNILIMEGRREHD